MLTLLTALLVAAAPADTAHIGSPAVPIVLTLNNSGNFMPGGLVNVRVEAAEDGYLIVFRIDGDGRVRVVFPLDPDGDAFVRGGKEYELRGRGDRSTFLADDRGGNGMVYAALSHQPYQVKDFSLNGHWDYDQLRLADSSSDAENDLTLIVSRMTNRARFDYDAVGYRVTDIASSTVATAGGGYYPGLYDPYYNPRWRCMSCGWGYPGSEFSVGLGYSPFWDPGLYSPWGYSNYNYYGYGYYGYGYPGRNWFPVVVTHNPRPVPVVPAGTRSRPRPETPSPGARYNAPPSAYHPTTAPPASSPTAPTVPPSSTGTRSRPRPADMTVTPPHSQTPDQRPVFRQPPPPSGTTTVPPRGETPQTRPVTREAPQVYRAPPPPPPPAPRAEPARSAPVTRSAPPPPPPPASSGGSRSRPVGGHG